MKAGNFIGQTLDNKYRIERELGKGGMGTVYLATHVGTERPVAVKVIAPQFMERVEFVERFRREARAAGRLRHPNVVNVTDFGLSDTKAGQVAYLVMEYLDGCTLGEVLEEEKRLSLSWSIDILEQVSSAIEEAHKQGIIHRDLKPDNIWLEPNQRGGYTVKVLDFGIAKLEEHIARDTEIPFLNPSTNATQNLNNRETVHENGQAETILERERSATILSESATMAIASVEPKTSASEAGTLIQSNDLNLEGGTVIMPAPTADAANRTASREEETAGTKLMSAPFEVGKSKASQSNDSFAEISQSSELTRVGAVLGTPLYMSPEQCRGEKLSPRSDIYSLAVIAYQMLSGKTPFAGDFTAVMTAHKETAPPPLDAKKIPRKVKKIIHSSLSKKPDERPQTAEAFASELRAQSEGIGTLIHRSLEIYTKHLPKLLGLALLLFTPYIVLMILKFAYDIYSANRITSVSADITQTLIFLPVTTFIGILCGQLISGTTTWIVMHTLAVPLRPIKIRPALEATRQRWKKLLLTGLLSTALTFLGLLLCGVGFFVMSVLFALVTPVVMMESRRGFPAMRRSKQLVMRSPLTTVAAVFIMYVVPFALAGIVSVFVLSTVKNFSDTKNKIVAAQREIKDGEQSDVVAPRSEDETIAAAKSEDETKKDKGVQINVDAGGVVKISDGDQMQSKEKKLRNVVSEGLTTLLMLPIQLLLAPLSSIIIALLYMKTRLVGGEAMKDLLAQFEEADRPRSNWQKRIRKRLEQSGKLTTSKP